MLAFAVAPAGWASQETGPASPFSPREQFRGTLHFLAPQQQRRPAAAFRNTSPRRGTFRLSHAGPGARRHPYVRYGYRAYGYPPWAYRQRGYPPYGGLAAIAPYDPYRAYRYVYYDHYYPYGYPGYYYYYPYGYPGY